MRRPLIGQPMIIRIQVNKDDKIIEHEMAMVGTVTNAGQTITGQLLIAGPRVGQFINPTNDRAIFLFDTLPGGKLMFTAIGAPATGWPDVTLDKCAG